MKTLGEIEARLIRHGLSGINSGEVFLLIRAVRELGADRKAWIETMRMIANGNKRGQALAMSAIRDEDVDIDSDVLALLEEE